MKNGKLGFLGKLSAFLDPLLRKKLADCHALLKHVHERNVRKVARAAADGVFHVFGTAGLFVSKHYENIRSRVRGKKSLKTGGVVSFFLKNVSESKGQGNEDKNHESK